MNTTKKLSVLDCLSLLQQSIKNLSKPQTDNVVVDSSDQSHSDAFKIAQDGGMVECLGGTYHKIKKEHAFELKLNILSDYPIMYR